MMMTRNLGVALTTAALLLGCGSDDNNANSNTQANSSANNTDTNSTPNIASSMQPQVGWRAQVTGADELQLRPPGGPVMVVGQSPEGAGFTGVTDENGATLTAGFPGVTLAVGEFTAGRFKIGWSFAPTAECVGSEVTFTITQAEPKMIGTFEGPVTCSDTPDKAQVIEATVSGEFYE